MSCSKEVEKSETDHAHIETNRSLIFPVPHDAENRTVSSWTQEYDGKLYYFHMGPKNSIFIYDVDNEQFLDKLTFDQVGPKGIGTMTSFFPGEDSLLYIFSRDFTLTAFSFEGEIISKFPYLKSTDGDIAGPSGSFNVVNGRLIVERPWLYFTVLPEGNWNLLNQEFVGSFKTEVRIDMESGLVEKMPWTYPDGYYSATSFDPYFSRTYANGRFVYSYSTSAYVYAFTLQGAVMKFEGTSQFARELKNYKTSDFQTYATSVLSFGRYRHIIWDKYRQLFYRFVYLGEEITGVLPDGKLLEDKIRFPSNYSIQVFDRDLNLLGEEMLSPNTYVIDNYIIHPDGLYLSTCNPANDSIEEDKMEFRLINLSNYSSVNRF